MRAAIEDFILYLATERGLSDNYQLSTALRWRALRNGWSGGSSSLRWANRRSTN
jgi:hypothetical protein